MNAGLVVKQTEMVAVALVFNCVSCRSPLLTVTPQNQIVDRRHLGLCAECEENQKIDTDAFDPYGQPFLSEAVPA